MAAVRSAGNKMQIEQWPEGAWRRLLEAVVDPARVWTTLPCCPSCGRPVAASDCEPDGALCWRPVTGSCS